MFDEPASIIENRIESILKPVYKILYENVLENPIAGETSIRLNAIGGNNNLISGTFDKGVNRFNGVFILEVFTQSGTGKRGNDLVCKDIYNCFDKFDFNNLKVLSIDIQKIGEVFELNLFKQNVILNYQYDKCS